MSASIGDTSVGVTTPMSEGSVAAHASAAATLDAASAPEIPLKPKREADAFSLLLATQSKRQQCERYRGRAIPQLTPARKMADTDALVGLGGMYSNRCGAAPSGSSSRDAGSRLVQCPCCQQGVHRLLINDHLETCGRSADAPRPERYCSTQHGSCSRETPQLDESLLALTAPATSPSVNSSNPHEEVPSSGGGGCDDSSLIVECPLCQRSLRNDEMFAHLDGCSASVAGCSSDEPVPQGLKPSSDANESADDLVRCPACGKEMRHSMLNSHLDSSCFPDGSPGPVVGGADGERGRDHIAEEKLDRLAAEIRCPVCFDLLDAPHSLPCNHTFCLECILGCFKVTSRMQCPLCKAPTWRRAVTPNHQLASIVEAFRSLQSTSSTSTSSLPST